MYVGKNPICRPSVRSACAQGDSRVIFSEFRKIQRKLPARSPCRKKPARAFSTVLKPPGSVRAAFAWEKIRPVAIFRYFAKNVYTLFNLPAFLLTKIDCIRIASGAERVTPKEGYL